ncbi:MAG TPA: glycoside hydrolase family 3 protein [Acholeplasmataceae bacterium]|jgi:beta-N-acetylhexosaminidase|nr:glycoside hydrolase family 3 protein [Acholeplasmataceae bacterium]
MNLKEKIGQMLCFAFHGQHFNNQLKTLITEYKVGGIVHFARNISSNEQVKKLNDDIQNHSDIPVFISLDQEGGMVRRIMNDITYLPGAMSLAATNEIENIYHINYKTACDLKSLGFNINYAPVADVNNNPLNPVINSRSYGDDPNFVAKCVLEAFKGIQDAKMLPTAKHFPGHGDTNVDSHLGLPVVTKTEEEIFNLELIPFIKAINSDIDGIMMSHVLYSKLDDKLPSSLSYNVITKLLKEKLGFKGLITTDSLTMGAIWKTYSIAEIIEYGVNAGNDILVFCGKADLEEQKEIINTFYSLVKEGKISESRIDESVKKILALKEKYCKGEPIITSKTNLSETLIDKSITKVFGNLLPLANDEKVLIIFPKIMLASLVDNENNTTETLGKYLNYPEIIISEDNMNLEMIVQNESEYDKIIMANYNVKKDDYQEKVYKLLNKEKTILIALRSPYDINLCKGPNTYICTYDCTKEVLEALSKKLLDNNFLGKLPIILEE